MTKEQTVEPNSANEAAKVIALLQQIMALHPHDRATLSATWSAMDSSTAPFSAIDRTYNEESVDGAAEQQQLDGLERSIQSALDLPAVQRGFQLSRIAKDLVYEEELAIYNLLVNEKAKRSIPFAMEIAVTKLAAQKPLLALGAAIGVVLGVAKLMLTSWYFLTAR